MKAIYIVIISILVVAGSAACAIGGSAAPTPVPPAAPTVSSSLPPSPVPAQSNGGAGSVFTLTENDLNRQIAAGMGQGEISNARVDIHPNNLADFSATVRSGNLTLEPRVSIQLGVQNGRMVIDVLSVEVGGFGLPSSLIEPQIAQIKQTAETELNKQFDEIKSRTGLSLHSLSTTENDLTLYMTP